MKIVVNKCYGGFGLSIEAKREIHKRQCPHQKLMSKKEYFGKDAVWKTSYKIEKEYQDRHLGMCQIPELENETLILDAHRDYEDRACPILVSVVEKLKEKAFGKHSSLEIVEIPDGIKYEISDYDGIETIHEEHRSW